MYEYPKALYKGANVDDCLTECATVQDAEQEAAARKDGYAMYAEIHARGEAPAVPAAPAAPVKRPYNRKDK